MSLRTTFFALTYDRQLAKVEQAGLGAIREELLSGASGRVLEVGGGTGANLAHYGSGVESLTVTEPEPAMLRRLEQRRWIKSRWGVSDNNRKAKFYELTARGRRQIREETENWELTVALMAKFLPKAGER